MTLTVVIREDGSIHLPQEILDSLTFTPGTALEVAIDDQQLHLTRKPWPSFHTWIGAFPLPDGLDAVAFVEEMRGTPEEREALHAGPPHPNVTYIGKKKP